MASLRSPPGLSYDYDRLEPGRQIRVLELTSPVGALRLEGVLLTVSNVPLYLPKYTAISYAWGADKSKPELISLGDNGALPLTSTAAHILRRTSRRLPLWIDSICINQNDGEEIKDQIPLMAHTHRSASSVCVWLGEWHKKIDLAFSLIRDIA
jgi:hypothetical protein